MCVRPSGYEVLSGFFCSRTIESSCNGAVIRSCFVFDDYVGPGSSGGDVIVPSVALFSRVLTSCAPSKFSIVCC